MLVKAEILTGEFIGYRKYEWRDPDPILGGQKYDALIKIDSGGNMKLGSTWSCVDNVWYPVND